MIKEAIEKILSLAQVEQFEIGGRKYTSKGIIAVTEPEPQCLSVNTLTGFVDYINKINEDDGEKLVLIKDFRTVTLESFLFGGFMQRKTYICAKANSLQFQFGKWYDVEAFIISLQSQFVQDDQIAAILKVVGNVTDGVVTSFKDDGVSQQVTAKSGVSRVENIPVPSPVVLKPFRTFLEIEQPSSKFIFRMRSGQEAPTCALFDADGGAWQGEAMLLLKDALVDALDDKNIPILA